MRTMEYEDYGKVFPFNNLLGKKLDDAIHYTFSILAKRSQFLFRHLKITVIKATEKLFCTQLKWYPILKPL